jgi:hypothetical protein
MVFMGVSLSMSMVAEITAQPTNDPNIKVWHSRYQMTSGPEAGSRGSDEFLGEFGRLLLDIEGVAEVQVIPYTALVKKAVLFEWDEVGPRVELVLGEFVRSQRQLRDAVDGSGDRV